MKKRRTSASRKEDQSPDIRATEDLMDKLLKVPKKELDKLLADEKNCKDP